MRCPFDRNFALNVKLLMALAFIPISDVEVKFDELMSQSFSVENEELLYGRRLGISSTLIDVCRYTIISIV